jgi:hypothetical protein
MINKIFKRIHNKYSTLFRFLFFLRYLFVIFLLSAVLFLLSPHMFDLKKKDELIKNYLLKNYGLTLSNYENIKYNSLPKPNFEIRNAYIEINQSKIPVNVVSLIIYPKLYNIHDFDNLEVNEIFLDKNEILLSNSDLKELIDYIFDLKNKITFKNLNIKIERNNKHLINLKKINISNHGYSKNKIKGEIFDKKFEILINDDQKKINFELLKTGIIADINFNEINKESKFSGVFKASLLNSKLKFNFDYDDKKLNIFNSYFRNKNLSFNNKSTIAFSPFFSLNSFMQIEDLNIKLLENININRIFTFKDLIKKLNIKNEVIFKSKKFRNNLIDNLNLNISLAYGRLVYSKKISISENLLSCHGDINLLEEYPILYFDCSIASNDKKKFLNKLSIKYKNKNELFKLNVIGNINVLNNKINFKKITMNKDYEASKEDLGYYKQSFETILFDKDFISIFNLDNIKDFILEVS